MQQQIIYPHSKQAVGNRKDTSGFLFTTTSILTVLRTDLSSLYLAVHLTIPYMFYVQAYVHPYITIVLASSPTAHVLHQSIHIGNKTHVLFLYYFCTTTTVDRYPLKSFGPGRLLPTLLCILLPSFRPLMFESVSPLIVSLFNTHW